MELVIVLANVNENQGKLTGFMKSDPVKITLRNDADSTVHQLPGV